jgi:hypothetical protein
LQKRWPKPVHDILLTQLNRVHEKIFMSRKNKEKRQNKLPPQLAIPPQQTTAPNLATIDAALKLFRAQAKAEGFVTTKQVEVVPPSFVKGVLAIATSAWRAKGKMVDSTTGEPHDAMARVFKDIERIYRYLDEIGFKIKDHTGDAYDDGQPMKVITSETRAEATRKYVLATLSPTIFWNDQIVQHGEIEIAVPPAPKNS